MLHWTPTRSPAAPIAPAGLLLPPAPPASGGARSEHARMLGHAAKRRLAARGEDAGYWKACAPAAVAKAARIRSEGFARLP